MAVYLLQACSSARSEHFRMRTTLLATWSGLQDILVVPEHVLCDGILHADHGEAQDVVSEPALVVAALADDNVQSLGDWSRPLTSGLVNNGVVRAF